MGVSSILFLGYWAAGGCFAGILPFFSNLIFQDTDAPLGLLLARPQPPRSELEPMTSTLVKSPGYPLGQGGFGSDVGMHLC